MMLAYPIHLQDDDNNTVMVSCPDFPELTTYGDDGDEALARAVDALEEAIAARVHSGRDIPTASIGDVIVPLPTLTAIKVLLYQGMREQGIGKGELARRLGWHLPQVDRALDIRHHSRLDQLDAALGVIGRQLQVVLTPEGEDGTAIGAQPPVDRPPKSTERQNRALGLVTSCAHLAIHTVPASYPYY